MAYGDTSPLLTYIMYIISCDLVLILRERKLYNYDVKLYLFVKLYLNVLWCMSKFELRLNSKSAVNTIIILYL